MKEAEEPYQRAIELLEQLTADYPDVPRFREELVWALSEYANILVADTERTEQAEATLRRLAVVEERLIADLPGDPMLRARRRSTYRRLAELLTRAGQPEKAEEEVQRAIESRERLVAAHPGEPKYREVLTRTYRSIGGYFSAAQRYDAAEAAFRRAVEVGEALVSSFPERPPAREYLGHAYRALARFLATCPDPALRRATEAVELAEKAVELLPEYANAWTTLGVARYRAEDWPGAIDAIDRSMELNDGGAVFDWLVLAMAYQQLADGQQAANWYARAARWIAENAPVKEEVLRFRSEAAELLGIEQEPPNGDQPESPQAGPD
jgi:tetratricopeptide (TPR) repeat protein